MTDAEATEVPGPTTSAWRRLVQGFLVLAAGEGAARLFGVIGIFVLARAIGPTGFGVVAVGTAMAAWYGLAIDNGTQVSSTPDIARRPTEFSTIVSPILGLRITVAVGAMMIVSTASFVFARSSLNAEVYALFTLAFLAAAPNMRWLALGVDGARELAFANALGQLAVMSLYIAFVHSDENILRVPLIYACGELVFSLMVMLLLARRLRGLVLPSIDLGSWLETCRRGAPLLVGAASRGVLLSFDLLVIAIALGPEFAGYYGAAIRPVLLAGTIVGLFSLQFLAAYSASGTQARSLFRRALVSSVGLSLSCAVGLSVIAIPLVAVVFGSAFAPAATLMIILAWRIPSMALAGVYASSLVAAGKANWVMRSNLAGAAFNIPAVVVAVHFFGVNAAAVVSVIASTVIALVNHHAAVRYGSAPRLRNLLARKTALVGGRSQ